jgi:hypothetical protein
MLFNLGKDSRGEVLGDCNLEVCLFELFAEPVLLVMDVDEFRGLRPGLSNRSDIFEVSCLVGRGKLVC